MKDNWSKHSNYETKLLFASAERPRFKRGSNNEKITEEAQRSPTRGLCGGAGRGSGMKIVRPPRANLSTDRARASTSRSHRSSKKSKRSEKQSAPIVGRLKNNFGASYGSGGMSAPNARKKIVGPPRGNLSSDGARFHAASTSSNPRSLKKRKRSSKKSPLIFGCRENNFGFPTAQGLDEDNVPATYVEYVDLVSEEEAPVDSGDSFCSFDGGHNSDAERINGPSSSVEGARYGSGGMSARNAQKKIVGPPRGNLSSDRARFGAASTSCNPRSSKKRKTSKKQSALTVGCRETNFVYPTGQGLDEDANLVSKEGSPVNVGYNTPVERINGPISRTEGATYHSGGTSAPNSRKIVGPPRGNPSRDRACLGAASTSRNPRSSKKRKRSKKQSALIIGSRENNFGNSSKDMDSEDISKRRPSITKKSKKRYAVAATRKSARFKGKMVLPTENSESYYTSEEGEPNKRSSLSGKGFPTAQGFDEDNFPATYVEYVNLVSEEDSPVNSHVERVNGPSSSAEGNKNEVVNSEERKPEETNMSDHETVNSPFTHKTWFPFEQPLGILEKVKPVEDAGPSSFAEEGNNKERKPEETNKYPPFTHKNWFPFEPPVDVLDAAIPVEDASNIRQTGNGEDAMVSAERAIDRNVEVELAEQTHVPSNTSRKTSDGSDGSINKSMSQAPKGNNDEAVDSDNTDFEEIDEAEFRNTKTHLIGRRRNRGSKAASI